MTLKATIHELLRITLALAAAIIWWFVFWLLAGAP